MNTLAVKDYSFMDRLIGAVVLFAGLGTLTSAASFDVRSFGAKGDGVTKDTLAIQKAIDACGAAGGGEVVVANGTFLSGSLILKSGVHLQVKPGAKILGSRSMADYPNGKLISATGAQDVTIEGGGIIDGQGESFWEKKPGELPRRAPWQGTSQFQYQALKRPSFIHLRRCTNVVVRNLLLTNSPSWTVHFERCQNVRASGVTMRSPLYGPNTDGFDVNSCVDVRIEDCDIITGDDGIVLKSTEPGHGHPSRDITIARCRIWSSCNGLKIGTETHDSFENIVFRDCHLYSASTNPMDRTLAGIAIESVDGSHLNGITVSNITMDNIKAPIFVRLGHRGGNSEKTRQVEPRVPGRIQNVTIQKIRATNSMFESSITGIPGHPVENIKLSDIVLEYEGGGTADLAEADVPDDQVKTRYPEAQMFGRLPAYGLYVRHVKSLDLSRVHFSFRKADVRSAVVCEDVTGLRLRMISGTRSIGEQPFLRFIQVADADIRECKAPEGTAVFLKAEVLEPMRKSIVLANNELGSVRKAVEFGLPGVDDTSPVFSETSPGVFIIPCERMKVFPPMAVRQDAAIAPGKFIEVPSSEGRDRGKAVCRFEVKTAGEYVFHVRALAQSGEDDTFYFGLDSEPLATSDIITKKKWAWDRVRNRMGDKTVATNIVIYPMTPGIHTLAIKNRESGAKMETLAIVRRGVDFKLP